MVKRRDLERAKRGLKVYIGCPAEKDDDGEKVTRRDNKVYSDEMEMKSLRQFAKRMADRWVTALRKKWRVRHYRVDRDGTIRWKGQPFALCFTEHDKEILWDVVIHSKPMLQYIGAAFACRTHLYVSLSTNPASPVLRKLEEKRASQLLLTTMLVYNFLKEILGLSIFSFSDMSVYLDSCIELPLPKWERVNDTSFYLRFPLIDEETNPETYSVYFVVDDSGIKITEAEIPYRRLRRLTLDSLHRMAASVLI
jgi:hypothetical protein